MTWVQFSHGRWRDPAAKESPEALVVLLHDIGDSAATLTQAVACWATTVPTAAFIAFDGVAQLDPLVGGLPLQVKPGLEVTIGPAELYHTARHIILQLERQLRFYRLDASRLVLVGFGHGGTLVLQLLLRRNCAGILSFGAQLIQPLPRIIRVNGKVRLIDCVGTDLTCRSNMRDTVASLSARGIDARGVVLTGSALSAEAIRHGSAYLSELVATAQQGRRFHVVKKSSDKQ